MTWERANRLIALAVVGTIVGLVLAAQFWTLANPVPALATTATPSWTRTPTPSPTPTFLVPKMCGDVNNDGTLTAIDAMLILQLHAGLVDALPNDESGDVNFDGTLSALDAMLVLQVDASLLPLGALRCWGPAV